MKLAAFCFLPTQFPTKSTRQPVVFALLYENSTAVGLRFDTRKHGELQLSRRELDQRLE